MPSARMAAQLRDNGVKMFRKVRTGINKAQQLAAGFGNQRTWPECLRQYQFTGDAPIRMSGMTLSKFFEAHWLKLSGYFRDSGPDSAADRTADSRRLAPVVLADLALASTVADFFVGFEAAVLFRVAASCGRNAASAIWLNWLCSKLHQAAGLTWEAISAIRLGSSTGAAAAGGSAFGCGCD